MHYGKSTRSAAGRKTHMMDYHAQVMCIGCAFSKTCSQGIVHTPVALRLLVDLFNVSRDYSIAQYYGAS
jgi:hypothetical protein